MDADVIIPITTTDHFLWLLNTVCIRTLRASTSARIVILGNNSPESNWQNDIKKQCLQLGVEYHYIDERFNTARFFNIGTKLTSGKYIAYGSADMIFYHRWLENIVDQFEKAEGVFQLAPYSYHPDNHAIGYLQEIKEKDEVVYTHWVSQGIEVLRRSDGYVFDENFVDWELDVDMQLYAKSKGLKSGIVMNARADHFITAVRSRVDLLKHVGIEDYQSKASAYLKKKWNLP